MTHTPRTDEEWATFRAKLATVGTDGCTGVTELYRPCCEIHDYHYRTGRSWWDDTTPISRAEADAAFWACMQARSPLKWASPVAAIRWLGVRLFGRKAYRGTVPHP